ncbi:MAG: hypothetical protein KKE73_04785 [Proteobacteria bacterium]|nr:hypothetical protein [Pseudomonadota bacterium]
MFQTKSKSIRLPGYNQVELILGFGLVALLMLGLLTVVNPFAGDQTEGIPSYRAANAMYIYSAIEQQRVAVMSYTEMTGALPGDNPVAVEVDGRLIKGNGNGRIEVANGEKDKVFPDLYNAGINPAHYVRVRGKILEFSWVELRDGDKILGVGHFFKLPGVHPLEARAYDAKHDDDSSDSGDVVYARNETEGVDLYIKFNLFR